MSGDVQTRQRRKDKKKQKRDDDSAVPGVDTSKLNEVDKKASVQMHVPDTDHDHGAGICAKVVFFSLMAILLGLVVLIVLENRGGSDLDTPLSESRFSEYLQGWVDEKREEDHHDEHPHFADDHEEEEGDHGGLDDHTESPPIPEDEPYPEEKDISNPDDDDNEESQELNAEINVNDSENDQDDPEDDDEPEMSQEEEEQAADDDDNNSQPQEDLFEDSTPFEEEKSLKGDDLAKQVDDLYDTFNEIASMLGKEKQSLNTKNIAKRDAKTESLKDDDEVNENENKSEDVVDNDEGEDLLLQKLAEEIEIAQQQKQEASGNDDDGDDTGSSSHKMQVEEEEIIVRSGGEELLLSKRRFTMLSDSDERLINEQNDNEEIIEVMMVSGPNLSAAEINENDFEEYSDEMSCEEEEEEEIYSDEEIDEFHLELHDPSSPHTFEDFHKMYRPEQSDDEPNSTKISEPKVPVREQIVPQNVIKVPESSPKGVEFSPKIKIESSSKMEIKSTKTIIEPLSEPQKQQEVVFDPPENEFEEDFEEEIEEELEDEEVSGEEFIDEDDIDYGEESEEISDVDDEELLKRLEAKYGKISDKSSEDNDWTKIPREEEGGAQSYMDELLKQQTLEENSTLRELYQRAKSLDAQAEKERSNARLLEAILSYKDLIEINGHLLNDTIFIEIAERSIERSRFIGKMKIAVDMHYKLIHRFVDEPSYLNQLAVTYLLANRLSAAKMVLHEVLSQWRYNGFALVHYGFVLKNLDNDYEQAVIYLREGIESNEPGTQDGRFYFNLGDALQRLGRQEEAKEVYRKGASIGLFLSEYQRSLYNVDRLKSKPFWTKAETTYKDQLTEIHKYWQIIRDEGLKLLSMDGYFQNEQENLKDTGDWKQFELFARGVKSKTCHFAPFTCELMSNFKEASGCKRGQIKFSVLHPNTHVHSHCGPTNTRIRAHLGLKVPEKTFIRVAEETRSWAEGEWLIFDDSFEHEVWHNGTSLRLVLIVDVWHPNLTEQERQSLSPI